MAVRSRAESVRVEVDGLQASGQGAGHVVPQAVADVQDGAAGGHAESVERDAEDGRIGLGHADHGGVDDHADPDPGRVRPGPVGGVAHAEAAQFGLHGAVGVRDHAHRQAERGQGPQPGDHPGADVRPGAAHGRRGDLGGQRRRTGPRPRRRRRSSRRGTRATRCPRRAARRPGPGPPSPGSGPARTRPRPGTTPERLQRRPQQARAAGRSAPRPRRARSR